MFNAIMNLHVSFTLTQYIQIHILVRLKFKIGCIYFCVFFVSVIHLASCRSQAGKLLWFIVVILT